MSDVTDRSDTISNESASKRTAREAAEASRSELVGLSHRLHANPEVAFQEYESSAAVADVLQHHGFTVERGVADLPTAFVATAGHGELVIGICAELDALPDIGHACGHNVIAAAATTAAIGLAAVADDLGVTVKVFATPAEELGGGKIYLLQSGAFAGVHAAMMVHPSTHEYPDHYARAVVDLDITYTGRAAHAAARPADGINAADAMTVAQVAIGLLRQQLGSGDLVHGIVTKGGEAPNVIPSETAALYDARAASLAELESVRERLLNCFRAGATATGATLQVNEASLPVSEFRNDEPMVDFYRANATALGREFDNEPIAKRLAEAGSTDMGNVSLAMPAIHPTIKIDAEGASNHQPEFARWCGEPSADQALFDGGVAMAWTAIDLAVDDDQRARLLAAPSSSDDHAARPGRGG